MPIKGLSERRRLPRLGKVRLGVMVHPPSGKPYPRSTDYLVCPPEIQEMYGERPKELPIMFPGDDPALLFPQQYKMYKTAGLWCSGDGETAHRWTDAGELKEIACPCSFLESGECGPLATLNFLIPDVPGVGVWQIDTGNKRSIESLNTSLEQFAAMFGGLSGIPFVLKLEPHQTQRFDDKRKQMVKTTIYVLRLDSTLTIRQIVEWRRGAGKPVAALMPTPEADEHAGRMLPSHDEEEVAAEGGDAHSTDRADTPDQADMTLQQEGGGSLTAAHTTSVRHEGVVPLSQTDEPAPAAYRGGVSEPVPEAAPEVLPAAGEAPADDLDHDDLETCCALARNLGATTEEYKLYLAGVYRVKVVQVTDEALAEQAELLRDAAASQTKKTELLRAIGLVAKRVTEGKVTAKGQGSLL